MSTQGGHVALSTATKGARSGYTTEADDGIAPTKCFQTLFHICKGARKDGEGLEIFSQETTEQVDSIIPSRIDSFFPSFFYICSSVYQMTQGRRRDCFHGRFESCTLTLRLATATAMFTQHACHQASRQSLMTFFAFISESKLR